MKRFIVVTLTAGVLVGMAAPPSLASWVSDHCFVDNSADTAITRSTARTYAEVAAKEGYEWGGGCWNDNNRDDTPNAPDSGGEGPDCSGLVFKSWELRASWGASGFRWWNKMQNIHGPYGSDTFHAPTSDLPFYKLGSKSRSTTLFMDAFAKSGHIGLLDTSAYPSSGADYIMEARGDYWGTRHLRRGLPVRLRLRGNPSRRMGCGSMHDVLPSGTLIDWGIARGSMRRLCLGLPVRVVVALALLPACSGSPTISSAGTPTSLGALPPPAGPSTPVREVRMRRLVLTADLSEAPARWRLVATIPFGASPQELGLVTDVHRTPIPDLPRSFAIGPDRSIWILDVVKRRVAHYSSDAAFLGAIGGFKFDRFSPHPRDMTFSGGQMFVLEEHHRESNVVTVDSTGTLHRVRPRVGNGEIGVLLLYPSVSGVAGLVVDQVQNADRPPRHFARFDPGSGAGVALPGVPVGEGRWIDLDAPSDADLDVTFTTTGRAAIQPIYIRAVTAIGPSGKGVEIVSGPRIESVTEGGVAIVVPISPARPGDADRYGGGVWLLRLGVDGKPLLWERLPAPGISDEEQVRRIATGPDGRLYLMVPTSEGEQIYAM